MKNSLYKKFFLCFLVVMLIPAIILSATVLFFTSYTINQNLENSFSNVFSIVDKELNDKMKQIHNSHSIISTDLQLINSVETDDQYDKFMLIKKFGEHKKLLGFCTDLGIINYKNGKVYSANGECDIDTYFDSDDSAIDYKKYLSQSSSVIIPYSSKSSTRFIYISQTGYLSDIFVFSIFEAYTFYNSISPLIDEIDGTVFMTSDKTNQIYQIGPYVDTKKAKSIMSSRKQNISNHKPSLNGDSLIAFHTLPNLQMKFYVISPWQTAFKPIITIVIVSILTVVLSLIVGILMVSLMAKYNYQPIGNIKKMISSDELKNEENELVSISNAISHMNSEISNLSYYLDTNRENIKRSVTVKLIYGQFKSEHEFINAAHQMGIEKIYAYFTICILLYDKKENRESIFEYFCNLSLAESQCFTIDNLENKQFILVFNSQNKDFDIEEVIYNSNKYIFQKLNTEITIGVSQKNRPYSELSSLLDSAVAAVNYSFVKGKYTISFSQVGIISENTTFDSIKPINMLALEKCIMECNNVDLVNLFYDKFNEILNSNLPLNTIKVYLFNMIGSIRKMLFTLNIEEYQNFDSTITNVFLNSESIEELFNSLYFIVDEISKSLQTITNTDKIVLIQNYIKEHLCDLDFNVNSISDYFGISLPSLSRFFKKHCNTNISDFISALKIDKAKELLVNTNLSIEAIVEQIGYANTSSFIRKFKTVVGITPGQFRNDNI